MGPSGLGNGTCDVQLSPGLGQVDLRPRAIQEGRLHVASALQRWAPGIWGGHSPLTGSVLTRGRAAGTGLLLPTPPWVSA